MFIAHLPAGYLLWRSCSARLPRSAVLLGAVVPDLDLLLVYGAGIAAHHQTFLTHKPLCWVVLLCFAGLIRWRWGGGLGLGAMLHLVLDSVVGRVEWGWPLMHAPVTLVEVSARFEWWVLSFLWHWTFAIEVGICLVAIYVARKTPAPSTGPGLSL